MSEEYGGKTKISNLFNSQPPDGEAFRSTDDMQANSGMQQNVAEPQSSADAGSADAGNPFAADFKSDMASQLSMDMSNFSQFFKDGAGAKKAIMLVAGVLLIGVAGAFFLFSGDPSGDSPSTAYDEYDDYDSEGSDDKDSAMDEDDSDSMSDADAESGAEEDGYDDESYAEDSTTTTDEEYSDDAYAEGDSVTGGAGAPRIISPIDAQARNYDETSEYALFEWEGEPGGEVHFSRSSTMVPIEKRVMVSGNSYRMSHPWPGTWYWKVVNSQGESEVSRFFVDAPVRRNVVLSPLAQPLSGEGGVVSWSGDTKVARYMVEITQSGWSNPLWRFQTSGTSLALSNVSAGSYQLRVGAFSEVAGRWEYSAPTAVTVE